MYTLSEVFDQAISNDKSLITKIPLEYSVIHQGMKIQRFSDRIEILDMNRGGDYYKVVEPEHYEMFFKYGWVIACLKMILKNCLHKLNLIEERIKNEVNTRKNDKHIQNLKNKREMILNKYTSCKQKLNSINY
tara:strand:- start:160 stop:558 length:399 start_codon:yes stop_codon:yes gene_type:complete